MRAARNSRQAVLQHLNPVLPLFSSICFEQIRDCRRQRNHLSHPVRHQLLPPAERHDAVADPLDLSIAQGDVSSLLCADRFDHAASSSHGLAAPAGRGSCGRQKADAVLAARRRGFHARRHCRAWPVAKLRDGAAVGRRRWHRLVDLPSRKARAWRAWHQAVATGWRNRCFRSAATRARRSDPSLAASVVATLWASLDRLVRAIRGGRPFSCFGMSAAGTRTTASHA